jgi:hypothetical protein
MNNNYTERLHILVFTVLIFMSGCGIDGCDVQFFSTDRGNFEASLSVSNTVEWKTGPGESESDRTVHVTAEGNIDNQILVIIESTRDWSGREYKIDKIVMLLTAERMFDAGGWIRLGSDEFMSTILTPSGLAIEGGTSGAVTERFGYSFKTPIDILLEAPVPGSTGKSKHRVSFSTDITIPADMPPGLYRLRADFGVRTTTGQYLSLNAKSFGARASTSVSDPYSTPDVCTYVYSQLIPVSGPNVNNVNVDAKTIQARIPWVILGNYNSNGYSGVVAEEDKTRFALSQRNIIHDTVVLPLYSNYSTGKYPQTYNLEPVFPVDSIDTYSNIKWDWTRGQLTLQIDLIDENGNIVENILGSTTAPIVAKSDSSYAGPTTKNKTFTEWEPPKYGRYAVTLTGSVYDINGREYQGGGTYIFWIAKRMTMATATFQGQSYPAGYNYGRDIGFSPPLPAHVIVNAELYNSSGIVIASKRLEGDATPGGIYSIPGSNRFPLSTAGEYHATILATATDTNGDLWVCVMRHAGVVYNPTTSNIDARGKKIYLDDESRYSDRGDTHKEGLKGTNIMPHISFPYNQGDVLLIASENTGSNKIEPGLVWIEKGMPDSEWEDKCQEYNGIGATNLFLKTSNGLSPHMFPEYITDREYYYAAAVRPGFQARFLVGDSNVRAPYWPTSPNSFGGQHGASYNGDQPGDLYRFLGGIVKRDIGNPDYAGYIASGAILPKGTNNNRVIAPGSEDIIGSKGARARFFLIGYRPGMVLPLGSSWVPAVIVDPILPVNISLTLTYPDGSTKYTTGGTADATGSWAGSAYTLNQPGVYKYTLSATWNGFTGSMPGLPGNTGEFYVMAPRPFGATGLTVDLPSQSIFSFFNPLQITGKSTATRVHYALLMPGAVIAQGEVPVNGGTYTITIDPVAIHSTTPIYDLIYYVTGQELPSWGTGKILHLSLFSNETEAGGFWDFRRVITRGRTVISAK